MVVRRGPSIKTDVKAKPKEDQLQHYGPLYGTYNFRLSISGSRAAAEMFTSLLKWMDDDYPGETFGTGGKLMSWKNPLLSDNEVCLLWSQFTKYLIDNKFVQGRQLSSLTITAWNKEG